MAIVDPEEFMQSLAPGVRARVEALQVRGLNSYAAQVLQQTVQR